MRKITKTILLAVLLLVSLAACNTTQDTIDSPQSAGLAEDAILEISGEGLSVTLNSEEMNSRELETFTCDHIDSNGDVTQVTVSGFSLDVILSENGMSLSDTASLNFVGSDGYIMSAPAEEYIDNGVYILLNYEGDGLSYPRSCIPDKRAMYWVRDLVRIEITSGNEDVDDLNEGQVNRIGIFREGVAAFEGEQLNNFGFTVTSYSLKDYYEEYIGTLPKEPLTMIARDGFKKTETSEVFFQNYVTYEAEQGEEEDLPLYFSETISDGMRVKQLDYVISGSEAVYFGTGVTVTELFETVGMAEAESYIFIASDGYETVIPADAVEYGLIYTDEEKGYIRASFDGYDWGDAKGGGKVKYLLTIIAETETENE